MLHNKLFPVRYTSHSFLIAVPRRAAPEQSCKLCRDHVHELCCVKYPDLHPHDTHPLDVRDAIDFISELSLVSTADIIARTEVQW